MIKDVLYFFASPLLVSVFAFTSLDFRLPFEKDESFYLTQGYEIGTHLKKDAFALDFAQNGCNAHGKAVLAVSDGVVKNVGNFEKTYGLYVDLIHADTVGRYAHLKEYIVKKGDNVKQGQVIGYIGNTGLKISSGACADYPGTHLHFRVTKVLEDGTEIAYKPEPISGYTNLLAGNWYKSDNYLAVATTTQPLGQEKKGWLSVVWGKIKSALNTFFKKADENKTNVVAVTGLLEPVGDDNKENLDIQKSVSVNLNSSSPTISTALNSESESINNNSTLVSPKNIEVSEPVKDNTPQVVKDYQPTFTVIPGFGGGSPKIEVSGGELTSEAPQQGVNSNSSDQVQIENNASTTDVQYSATPSILSPALESNHSTSTVVFSGTSTPLSVVFAHGHEDVAIVNDSGEWTLQLELEQGTSTLSFFAIEENRATSSPAIFVINIDSSSPTISLAISECQYSIIEVGCALPIASTTAILNINENSTTTLFVNGELVLETIETATTTILSLENGTNEIYAVSKDLLGNTSTSTYQNVTIFHKPIVINEVAWRGTSVSPFDEWIELESQVDVSINMGRFSVEAKDLVLQIPLSGYLENYGYYLIERTDDEAVPTVGASMVTPFSGQGGGSGLSNNGEELLLKFNMGENSVVIDKTPEISVCGGWCNAGVSSGGTMVRLNPARDGALQVAWGDDPNTYVPIFERAGIQIAGTPKAGNYSNPVPQI